MNVKPVKRLWYSAVAGAIAGAIGVGNNAPLGGVLILPVVVKPLGYLLALAAGVAVSALLVNLLKPNKEAKAKE